MTELAFDARWLIAALGVVAAGCFGMDWNYTEGVGGASNQPPGDAGDAMSASGGSEASSTNAASSGGESSTGLTAGSAGGDTTGTPTALTIVNQTGAVLDVRCPNESGPDCTDWTLIESGSSTALTTNASSNAVMIDNRQYWGGVVPFDEVIVKPRTTRFTIYPNAVDPLVPAPRPAGTTLQIVNQTEAGLWIMCVNEAGAGCDTWVYFDNGETGSVATNSWNRSIYIDNSTISPVAVPFNYKHIAPPSASFTLFANASDPLSP